MESSEHKKGHTSMRSTIKRLKSSARRRSKWRASASRKTDGDDTDAASRHVVGVLWCLNKFKFSGSASGIPFHGRDVLGAEDCALQIGHIGSGWERRVQHRAALQLQESFRRRQSSKTSTHDSSSLLGQQSPSATLEESPTVYVESSPTHVSRSIEQQPPSSVSPRSGRRRRHRSPGPGAAAPTLACAGTAGTAALAALHNPRRGLAACANEESACADADVINHKGESALLDVVDVEAPPPTADVPSPSAGAATDPKVQQKEMESAAFRKAFVSARQLAGASQPSCSQLSLGGGVEVLSVTEVVDGISQRVLNEREASQLSRPENEHLSI
jgi:hypothetical protein